MSNALFLRLTDAAEADLAEAWAYLAAEASEAVADRFLASIASDFDRLVGFPFSGAPRDHLSAGVRAAFRRPYVIYYRVEGDILAIVRVLHGARDVDTVFATDTSG